MLKITRKNGALPFTCCERGMMNTEIIQKTEHCRSHRKKWVAVIQWLATEKRSMSVHFFHKTSVRVQKTEHFRSLYCSFLRYLYVEANLTYNIRPWQERQKKWARLSNYFSWRRRESPTARLPCVFWSIPVNQFRWSPFSPLVIFSIVGKVNTFFSNSLLKDKISLLYARFCPDKPLQ